MTLISKQYIQDGFPLNRSDCVESVQGYFGFREELAIVNGLIVKGHWVVIPSQLHDEALKLLHSSHMGIVKTKDRARTSFFWLVPLCNIPRKTTKGNLAK